MDPMSSSDKESLPTTLFFSLPRELRDAIYELCIFDPLAIDMVRGEHPQWLLTSKQIFFEAAPMVYGKGCLHRTIDLDKDTDLPDQLCISYISSFSNCSFGVRHETFAHVKRMISNIAIDVQLDMNVPQIDRLSEHYFSRLDQLPNLKHLYISLHPIPGREFSQFRQQLSRSDLRIFQVVSFVKPVEALLALKPKGCRIDWMIPDSIKLAIDCEAIRLAADGKGRYLPWANRPELAEFMREVEAAVAATEPQADVGGSQVSAEAIG